MHTQATHIAAIVLSGLAFSNQMETAVKQLTYGLQGFKLKDADYDSTGKVVHKLCDLLDLLRLALPKHLATGMVDIIIIIMLPNQAIASTPSALRPSGAEGRGSTAPLCL
jgi:hypothetical protein